MRRRLLLRSTAVLGFGLSAGVPLAPAVAAGGGGGCPEVTEGTGTVVELVNFCFTPSVIRVEEGATVTFVNRDEAPHNVTGGNWGSPALEVGDEITQRFDTSGTYAYSCTLHGGMVGAVVVGDGIGTGTVVEVAAAPEPVAAVAPVAPAAPTTTEDDGSTAGAVAVAAGALVIGLGAGGVVGRRTRRAQ